MSSRAWVTLATNDSYGLGALVLAHSLRRANSAHPAVVLITPSVTEAMRNRLSAVFAEVITVNVLDSQDAAHLALLQRPELGVTFTKIHCWTLTQYQKCVFLDADTLIVQNCDELFDREEFSAAPDVGWPDCFNSGVFVFVPSQETYTRLINFAQERGSFDGGDQGLLNAFFADWAHGDINKHLPFLYNVTSAAFYSYIPALKHYGQDLKIIHFIGAAKPWLQQFNWESRTVDAPEHLRQFLQLWWDLFVGQVHIQLDSAMELAVEEEQGPLVSPPENPPEDTQHHYEPEINTESEFPWHWPEAQTQETENYINQVNMIEIHDPWEHCRGNIPPKQDYLNQHSEEKYMQNEEEIRKYAWEYRESNQNVWQQIQQHEQTHHKQQSQHPLHHSYDHDPNIQHHYTYNHSHQFQRENYHQDQTFHEHETRYEHTGHHWQDDFKRNDRIYHPEGDDHQTIEHQVWQNQQNQSHHEHSHFEQNEHSIQFHQCNQFNDHSHNSHHDNQKHDIFNLIFSQESHKHLEISQRYDRGEVLHDHEAQTQKHSEHHPADQTQKHSEISFGHQHNGYKHFNPYTYQKNIEHVYHIHLDHRPRRVRHRRPKTDRIYEVCSNGLANGHLSDSESEEEYIIPRHPYDGFYLRHRPTIDPRGRKICTHEIPPTPLPSPPAEEPSSRESSPIPCEDFETASECEDQYESGVAGNLARVVPGSGSYQREAIDDLTRRQGWEAGNIDYMGADSFDNIWAKISQTLNQQPPKQPSPPRKEPTPPKESSPPKESEQPKETPKPVEAPATVATASPEAKLTPTPAPAVSLEAASATTPVETVTSAPVPTPELPKPVEEIISETPKPEHTQKTESTVPPTPPATPKSSPEASSPVTESAPKLQTSPTLAEAPKSAAPSCPKPNSPAAAVEAPATGEPTKPAMTPEKPQDSSVTTTASTDSPPLANTPSKEEAPTVTSPQTEERRKPVEKLQLSPPLLADTMPTPDSELEDAAALAHAIIASELSTSVTAPSPAADVTSPPPLEEKRLSVEAPEVPTPPVSLAQIGVKPKGKPTTAAQIETSVSEIAEPAAPAVLETPVFPTQPAVPDSPVQATPTTPTTPSPPSDGKKKPTKKITKKEGGPSGDTPTPVPPPRKKEKKPKEK